MAGSSIVNTLGAGSGIDIQSLVGALVDAQFTPRLQVLNRQNSRLGAQISAVGSLKSNLTNFATGLSQLAGDGTLTTAPTSANPNVVRVSAVGNQNVAGLAASVEVRQLATAQVAATNPVADPSSAIGTGTLTLRFGTATVAGGALTGFTAGAAAPVTIAIGPETSSLRDIAKAINAANAGVTATILTDADGARLSLKGRTGAAQAFTLTASEDADAPGLAALDIGVGAAGTTIGSVARDAIVAVDGVALRRPSNAINDLLDGVRLDLVSAAPGSPVAIGAQSPAPALAQAVNSFVSAYNDLRGVLKGELDAKSGSLFGDPAAVALDRSLRGLTLTRLATTTIAGAPSTLAQIGVATNRDGTLSVNAARLNAALATYPDAVEALFANGSGASGGGLAAAFKAIADAATNSATGLGASESRYTKARSGIAEALDRLSTQQEQARARLTQQFSTADSRVAAYKAVQAQLTQQVAAWNARNN